MRRTEDLDNDVASGAAVAEAATRHGEARRHVADRRRRGGRRGGGTAAKEKRWSGAMLEALRRSKDARENVTKRGGREVLTETIPRARPSPPHTRSPRNRLCSNTLSSTDNRLRTLHTLPEGRVAVGRPGTVEGERNGTGMRSRHQTPGRRRGSERAHGERAILSGTRARE